MAKEQKETSTETADDSSTKRGFTLPTLTLSASVILGLLATYIHFFGVSYRKGFLTGAGFESVTINLSPEESIYYAGEALAKIVTNLVVAFDFRNWEVLVPGIAIGLIPLLLCFWGYIERRTAKASRKKRKGKSKGGQSKSKPKPFNEWMADESRDFLSAVKLAGFGVVVGTIGQILLTLMILFVILLFTMALIAGRDTGIEQGSRLAQSPVCNSFSWDEVDKKTNRVLGCRTVELPDGRQIKGIRVHSDKNVTYILANDGAYELDSKKSIVSFRPVHVRPEKTDKEQSD